jgi:hypothetical protein
MPLVYSRGYKLFSLRMLQQIVATTRGLSSRHSGMTALGTVLLWRAYFACTTCGLSGYLANRLLGLEGYLTRQARRLICLLGGRHSFAVAESCWSSVSVGR